MRSNDKPLLFCTLLASLWLFSGCTSKAVKKTEDQSMPAQQNAEPKQETLVTQPFVKNEQPEHIVEVYQHPLTVESLGLSETPQTEHCLDSIEMCKSYEQNQQRLQVVDSLIQSGDGTSAKQNADAINAAMLPAEQRAQLSLLYAQILLSFGEAEQTIDSLALLQPQQFNTENRIKYFQSQGFAYSLTGNLLASAKSRIELHSLLQFPDELEKNQAAILEALNLLPDSALQTSSTGILAGWMTLAGILKKINQPDFNNQINHWRATYPTHPADLSFLERTPDASGISPIKAKAVALLLPESGSFAQAGKAIRAGFLAASNNADNRAKLTFKFYDSEQSTPQTLYNKAIAEGAQLIIGPLAKEQIQSLAETVTFNVPVLALNHIPGLQKTQLYQFSLSPIDDTEQLTHKASTDGHKKVLMFMPDNAPGKRISTYLTEYWQNQSGSILETQTYNPKETDFSLAIQKLLNLDESEQRYRKIQTLLPGVKYRPRRRQDIDAIFLSAYSAEARSINPQLQYFQAGDLPVYAMPNVYSGQVSTLLDADLNKITFCDIPWLFNQANQGGMGMDALKDTWKQFPSSYLRLIAMGIDAYNLATQLDNLELSPYAGATGILSLTTDQRIQRRLTCATFKGGQPEVGDEYQRTAPTLGKANYQNHAIY